MATATEISTRALKRLGLVNSTESPDAADIVDATAALNAMIQGWGADALSGETLPLDSRFEQAVVAMLAVRLAEDYGATPGQVLLRDAQRGEAQITGAFFNVPNTKFEATVLQPGTNYMWGSISTDPVNYTAWEGSTVYPVRFLATNLGNIYEVVTSGTSADVSSGGPTGTGSAITDGTVTWCWRRVVPA